MPTRMRQLLCVLIPSVMLAGAGCQNSSAPPAESQPSADGASTAPADTTGLAEPASDPDAAASAESPAAAATDAPTEQVAAKAGVGIQGQSLEQHSGVLVEPAKAFFRFKQNVVFDIQIPSALKLFEASEGRKPNSQDEFMSRVVQANQINLPRLPDGHKYIYDAETGELKVERPAK